MGDTKTAGLAAILLAAIAAMVGAALLKGALLIGQHEGDTLHFLDMVTRMVAGERPHVDFSTPIGFLAVAPVAVIASAGIGAGKSFILAQLVVALVLLPAILRAAVSRFVGAWQAAFGLAVVVLCCALVYGGTGDALSISMHYNRWGWAVGYVVLALSLLPPKGAPRPVLDGALIGAGMAALALTKITFLVGFAAPVALAFMLNRDGRGFLAALVAAVVVLAAPMLWAGPGLLPSYIGDLLDVVRSNSRQYPGLSLAQVVAAPLLIGASLVLMAAVVVLRRSAIGQSDAVAAARMRAGLLVLTLAPGLIYITYQNFGNDPLWLFLLGLMLFAWQPGPAETADAARRLRPAFLILGTVAFSLGLGSMVNLATSPFRHLAVDEAETAPLVPGLAMADDLLGYSLRLYQTDARVALESDENRLGRWPDLADRDPPGLVNDELIDTCSLEAGLTAWYVTVAQDLEQAGFGGRAIFVADVINPLALYGGFRPLPGAAPWHYSGLPGLEGADVILVPRCAIAPHVRADILTTLAKSGAPLRELRRTPLYYLMTRDAP